MSQAQKGNTAFGLVLIALVAISFFVFGVLLGPGRAATIARSASASIALDGFAEQPALDRLTQVDVELDKAQYVNARSIDKGGSATGKLVIDGSAFDVVVTFTGAPTEHEKRSFFVAIEDPPTRLPFGRMEFRNPITSDMLQEHMALWVAGEVGAVVPFDALVTTRINGEPTGVMELREVVGPDLERARGLSPLDVTVSAIGVGPDLPVNDSLSKVRAGTLHAALNDPLLTAYARRDSIAKSLDVEALLHYMAALELLNTNIAEHAWVFSHRHGMFFPVLCASGFMDRHSEVERDSSTVSPMLELIELMNREPEWRARRDAFVQEGKAHLLKDDLFVDQWREQELRLSPSLFRDHEKHARIVQGDPGTYGYSIRRAVRTSATFRDRAIAYWRSNEATVAP